MNYRVRLAGGEFWTLDDVVETYHNASEALEVIDQFLHDSYTSGMEHTSNHIQAVAEDGTVLSYCQLADLAKGETP